MSAFSQQLACKVYRYTCDACGKTETHHVHVDYSEERQPVVWANEWRHIPIHKWDVDGVDMCSQECAHTYLDGLVVEAYE